MLLSIGQTGFSMQSFTAKVKEFDLSTALPCPALNASWRLGFLGKLVKKKTTQKESQLVYPPPRSCSSGRLYAVL
jgi:hypothetical protein